MKAMGGRRFRRVRSPLSDSYTVGLASAPTANVYVTVSAASSEQEDAALGGRSVLVSLDNINFYASVVVTFTPGDLVFEQTIYVRAQDDTYAEGKQKVVISHSSSSADAAFNRLPILNVIATVADDDQAGLEIVQNPNGTLVLEGDALTRITSSYTVALTHAPAAGKTVTIDLGGSSQLELVNGSGNPLTSLVFTAANWNIAQAVYIRATNDGAVENRQTVPVTHIVNTSAANADLTYVLVEDFTVNVSVVDDDHAGILVQQTNGSTFVVKNGANDTFSVRLTSAPTQSVTVSLNSYGQTLYSSADSHNATDQLLLTFDTPPKRA